MLEYPSIPGSSKAPKEVCYAFEKLDGSNIRVKYTHKKGFHLFGSRHELIDASHPHLGQVIEVFNTTHAEKLTELFKEHFPHEKTIIAFGEFYGPNSFAGLHEPTDIKQFTLIDILLCQKGGQSKFVHPKDFVDNFQDVAKAQLLYTGNLNDEFIKDVKTGKYPVVEGVVCKGFKPTGAYRGKIWMCKIKTDAYIARLKERFKADWEKYF